MHVDGYDILLCFVGPPLQGTSTIQFSLLSQPLHHSRKGGVTIKFLLSL